MADVTISSLPLGTPSEIALLPYSQGGTTYSARPSAFVTAGVLPGSIVQCVYSTNDEYYSTTSGSFQPTNLICSITPRYNNSNIKMTVSFFGRGQGVRGGIGIVKNFTPSFFGNFVVGYYEGIAAANNPEMYTFTAIDTSNTIASSTQSYKLVYRTQFNTSSPNYVSIGDVGTWVAGPYSTMILEEVAK